jgi:hypothetical protein
MTFQLRGKHLLEGIHALSQSSFSMLQEAEPLGVAWFLRITDGSNGVDFEPMRGFCMDRMNYLLFTEA